MSTPQEIGAPLEYRLTGQSNALIISNNFKGTKEELLGYDVDVDNIKKTFTELNVEFQVEENLKAKEMKNGIGKWLRMTMFEENGCAMVFVLTHGTDGDKLLGVDHLEVKVKEIREILIDCKELYGKPKLIFIQACRGVLKPLAINTTVKAASAGFIAKDANVFTFYPTAEGRHSHCMTRISTREIIEVLNKNKNMFSNLIKSKCR